MSGFVTWQCQAGAHPTCSGRHYVLDPAGDGYVLYVDGQAVTEACTCDCHDGQQLVWP